MQKHRTANAVKKQSRVTLLRIKNAPPGDMFRTPEYTATCIATGEFFEIDVFREDLASDEAFRNRLWTETGWWAGRITGVSA